MPSILFLCHRLPWPPSKGDKIRSYHVLRRLAEHYAVFLGTFVDDPADWGHVPEVEAVCAGTCIRPLRPRQARRRALGSLVRGEALTSGFYRDRVLQKWVDHIIAEHRPAFALCYSSGVAPLVMHHHGLRRIMDFVDADSDKWRQYAQDRHGLSRMIYRREARRLAQFERAIAAQFDASLFVSEAEAAFFRAQAPAAAGRVHGVSNGVDAGYWNPQRDHPSPYHPDERVVVFVGAMDYRANVHAAQWFVHEVWPRVLAKRPDARFYIVGARPTREVRMLERSDGVIVTGQVDDVRPYLAHAYAAAAPLRIARGIQNKVLEALAMEKVVLATPAAWEGIEDFEGREGCISDLPGTMAEAASHWLGRPEPARVPAARAVVQSRFDWARNLDAYEDVLRGAQPGAVRVPAVRTAEGLEACP